MKRFLILKISLWLCCFWTLKTSCLAQLAVSENHRYLVNEQDQPFFWLGDTGWGLFQKLSKKEVDFYFKTRARQGFTTIHAAAVHKNPFIIPELENLYGDPAFIDEERMIPALTPGNDPSDPFAYDYWDHVDFIIDRAEKYGIQIVFLPLFNLSDGDAYNLITENNALGYGQFLGKRYRDKTNIIWCIGGDVLADNAIKKSIWNLLAKGINWGVAGNEDYSNTLMTFHTRGGHSSTDYFQDSPWIDFHMLQTWDLYTAIYERVFKDFLQTPISPILHGEGAYEDGPEYPTKPITPHKIRKQAYWAAFAGGMHTYGNSNVWSFGTNPKYVTEDWETAVSSDGALSMKVYSKLMQQLEWWKFEPNQSLILEGMNEKDSLNVAMYSPSTKQTLVYLSEESEIVVDLSLHSKTKIKIVWYDPSSGTKRKGGKFTNRNSLRIKSPEGWKDALLVISPN